MTLVQIEAFAVIGIMFALFAADRLRFDVVAMLALLAAVLLGVVPQDKAFSGFSNSVIIIIACVLVVGRAIAISGVLENVVHRLLRHVSSTSLQVMILTACVTFLSAFMKNVGTLAIFMPIAIQTARRSSQPRSIYLMPLAFGSLVGGTITLIGTSPNLLISTVRVELGGKPFGMFDYTPVGLPLACLTVLFLGFAWRVLPRNRMSQTTAEEKFSISHYTTEMLIPEHSPAAGKTVGEFEAAVDSEISVATIIRDGGQRYIPAGYWTLFSGDVVAVQGDPASIKKAMDFGRLTLAGAARLAPPASKAGEMQVVEAVVTPSSMLMGETPESLDLRGRYRLNLLAVSRSGAAIDTSLRAHRFQDGDVAILEGWGSALGGVMQELGLLPLADRGLTLGRSGRALLPLGTLLVAMGLIAFRLLPAEIAIFGAAVVMIVSKQISLKDAYDAIDWPIIIMLGCLIPVGHALKDTGATDIIAGVLTQGASHMPPFLALAAILVTAMLVTPLLHHAAAVLVMGPVAATVASNLHYNVDPFLMAVAIGAASDFLTPIGHQNNMLVMGPGGYRFGDYWKLGLPLSIMVAVVGTALIMLAWPL